MIPLDPTTWTGLHWLAASALALAVPVAWAAWEGLQMVAWYRRHYPPGGRWRAWRCHRARAASRSHGINNR